MIMIGCNSPSPRPAISETATSPAFQLHWQKALGIVVLATLTLGPPALAPAAALSPSPITLQRTSVLGAAVTVATIALDAPGLQVGLETAQGGAGRAEPLAAYGKRLPPVAVAVPGAYISITNGRPVGNLVADFRVLNQAPSKQRGTTLAFDAENRASIVRGLAIRLGYQINDGLAWWERPDHNLLHGLNSPLPPAGDSLKGYNRYYTARRVALGKAHGAVIEGERVTSVWKGGTIDIPPYGFVVAGQGSAADKIDRLVPGTWLHVQPVAEPPVPGRLRTAIGAGPTLVRQGRVAVDWRAEGFRDPAVAGRTRRVIIGLVSPVRLLVMLIEGGVDLPQAGRIALALGCTEAMALDGGGSSGLWAFGQTVVAPTRPLTNVLTFSVPGARLAVPSAKPSLR
jgi:hypothetical protein